MFGDGSSRVFGLPPGVDFATELARGVLSRMAGQPPEALARVQIYTNARRAARRIEDVFQAAGPLILPRIDVMPELAADPAAPVLPSAGASPLARWLEIMKLVTALLAKRPDVAPQSAAFDLSQSLVTLLDEMQGEDVPFSALIDMDLGELNAHRETTLQFLRIIARIAETEAETPMGSDARLRRVADALAASWKLAPPAGPVIVAGSTGSRGATRRLMAAVLALPQGGLILPGFDFDLDDRSWAALDDGGARHDHPQHGFYLMSGSLGFKRRDVARWTDTEPPSPARNRLISLALRAAPVTDAWFRDGPALVPDLPDALSDVTWAQSPSPRIEAATIALAIRQGIAEGKATVLITPDGTLSRRVTAHLARWSITPDESGGVPLTLTPPAVFLALVMAVMGSKVAIADFLALLKHPLTAIGGDRGAHMRNLRALEKKHLRSGAPYVDWAMIAAWGEKSDCAEWVAWLQAAFATLAVEGGAPLDRFVGAHRAAATALVAGPGGTDARELWDVNAGPQCGAILDQIDAEAGVAGPLALADYRVILSRLMADEQARLEGYRPDSRVAIWGLLEARVQTADLVILGGLNEGIWPSQPKPDPWLNRAMRNAISLPAPDRQIGLSAHDFQHAIAQKHVIISRAERDGSAPTVASRWLTRLENLLSGLGEPGKDALAAMQGRGAALVELADRIDRPTAEVPPEPRPSPAPPLDARPETISATAVERLVRDPYAIYASNILRLRPMAPPTRDPNAMDRGIALHEVMEAFVDRTRHGLPPDAVPAFLAVAEEVLRARVGWTTARHIWLARLARISTEIVADEARRRAQYTPLAQEISGRINIGGLVKPVVLTAKADRIDHDQFGQLAILDYKSSIPTEKQEKIFSKQLPLEALIAQRGGFDGIGRGAVTGLELIGLGTEYKTRSLDMDALDLDDIWTKFRDLLARFLQPTTGYTARMFPFREDEAGDYDHLARRGEWSDGAPTTAEPIP